LTTRIWTAEQAAAITAQGHTLLVANAGTGKTTTVVGKVRWLLGQDVGTVDDGTGIPRCDRPCRLDEIAAITFTEKAAHDLKEKLREQIRAGDQGEALIWQLEQATLGTIHSFCAQLLREHALRLGIDPTFSVLEEQDARLRHDQLMREIVLERLHTGDEDVAELVRTFRLIGLGEFGRGTVDLARTAFRDLRWHAARYTAWTRAGALQIERLRELFRAVAGADTDLEADTLSLARCRGLYGVAQEAVVRWREYERAENVRDFDSLILDARALLTGPDAQAALQNIRRRYRILIIDEFQDTDGAQRDIAYAIAGLTQGERASNADRLGPQLFLVGDPKQSIYRFRGADISVWNAVAADIQHTLPLSLNFRSDPAVVGFVNVTAEAAIEATGLAVEQAGGARVRYAALRAARAAEGTGRLEWLVPERGNAEVRRASEGDHLAARIRALIDGKEPVIDADTRVRRDCAYRDMAVLYRSRTDLHIYQDALRRAGVPYYEHSPAGLAGRQEILDLLTLLRLLHNQYDDLRAFAFLRSPFVGLRDEVLARLRLELKGGSLLWQARQWLERGEWFAAPEHAQVSAIERHALAEALRIFERARRLADRVPIDELLEQVLQESGYRNHLMLLPGCREALANIQSFLRVGEQFRDHSIGSFLQLWDELDDRDEGLPQAQLYSRADDVVTFSTIHSAKGLEWPIVFLIDCSSSFRDRTSNEYWCDPELGPLLCPRQAERGPRAARLAERNQTFERAEEARLLYVAATRARDKLIVVGEEADQNSYAEWLWRGVGPGAMQVVRTVPEVPVQAAAPRITLAWLDAIGQGAAASSARPLPPRPHRWLTSATELMTKERDPHVWTLLYQHGVEPFWQFAPRARKEGAPLPERVRGTLIHGVLERMRADIELAVILEETIGALDAPELELILAPGTMYRAALEQEIERVIQSDQWKWYVAGEHYRELPFLHLLGPREWRTGSFDLYRPEGWIIDFKTHQISADRAAKEARHYHTQMRLYREAAALRGEVKTRLHFTHPNVTVDV
jgi:ATP-dependent helicase/nuclease subunit A